MTKSQPINHGSPSPYRHPNRNKIILIGSLLGLFGLFVSLIIGLNVYVHFFYSSTPHTLGLETKSNELDFLLDQHQKRPKNSLNDTLRLRFPPALSTQTPTTSQPATESSIDPKRVSVIESPTKTAPPQKEDGDFFVFRDYSVNHTLNMQPSVHIPIGSVMQARLLSDLSSASGSGRIVAKVTSKGRFSNATLVGQFTPNIQSKRIFVRFSKLVDQAHREYRIVAVAQDENGLDGLIASIQYHTHHNILQHGLSKGVDLLSAYVGFPLDALKDNEMSHIETRPILSVEKNKIFHVFFQESAKI